MTRQQAIIYCIDHPGELVRDNAGQWHQVSMESGAPRIRSDIKSRALDPISEPYAKWENKKTKQTFQPIDELYPT